MEIILNYNSNILSYNVRKDEGGTITLNYKNITLFILLGVKASVVYESDGDRDKRQISIMTNNFFWL